MALHDSVHRWLEAFATAVRDRNLEAGRELFTPDVVAYGTRVQVALGRDALLRDQWSPIWAATHGFRFTAIDLIDPLNDGGAIVLARWTSDAVAGHVRSGRATLILTRWTDAGPVESPLQCSHSHYSLDPADGGQVDME